MEEKPKPKATIEDLLVFINEMLKTMSTHKGPINISPDVVKDIDKLEETVAAFKEDADELFDLLNVDYQELEKEILESPGIRSSDKQLIKRAEDIQQNAKVIKFALSKKRGKGRKNQPEAKNQSLKQQMKERRKLFKTIGGDNKWIPL